MFRELPLFESVKPFIQSQRRLSGDFEYIFIKKDGTPWADTQWIAQSYWYPLLERVGLKKRRSYEMRHTFATNMLNSGHFKVNDIARMLGHITRVFKRLSKYRNIGKFGYVYGYDDASTGDDILTL